MADPTGLTISMSQWQIYLSLAVYGICTGLGSEIAKYVFNRWFKPRFDKAEIIVNKDSIEFSTKTKMTPTKTIWEEEKGEYK